MENTPFPEAYPGVQSDGLKAVAQAVANADVFEMPLLKDEAEDPILGRAERELEELGIAPLGHFDGAYFFISAHGEKRVFKARDLVRLNIASLFGGDTSWLCDKFPCFNKRGEPIDDAFQANVAAEWLMRLCARRGLFSPSTPMRGLGVWRSKKGIVAHFGSAIWCYGKRQKVGCLIDGAIYAAQPKLEEPDFDAPASAMDCRELRQYMNSWSYTQEFDADLLFGFLGAGLLGGYPSWRVHAILTGERGTGKSTFAEYLMNVLGDQGMSFNNYTEAGLRQNLGNEGRMICLDEGEGDSEESMRRMARVIALLRLMSGGDGAKIVRGTSGGVAQSSTVTGSVMMAAINPPPLKPQDKSRILVVPIKKPEILHPAEDIKYFLKRAREMSPKVRARALLGVSRFEKAFDLYRGLLLAMGCDARQADLYATLCAGRSLLLHDDVPDVARAQVFVEKIASRLKAVMLDDDDESDGRSCLNHIMGSSCEAMRDGVKRSIGMIVASSFADDALPQNEILVPIGLRIVEVTLKNKPKSKYLFVPNKHPQLEKLFKGTQWSGGGWRSSLLRLDDVKSSPRSISVGFKVRGQLVPRELLPGKDNEGAYDFSDDDDPVPPYVLNKDG